MKNKGITLVTLTITIIVIMILAGITINIGYDLLNKAKLESLKTNMLLIQAKTKVSLEEYNFSKDETKLIGTKVEESNTNIMGKLNKIGVTSLEDWYYLQQSDLDNMNLPDVKPKENEYFLVKYNKQTLDVEVLYTEGFKGSYTLTDIQTME